MQLSHFDYDLPHDLIAQFPTPNRSQSRLLCVRTNFFTHHVFNEVLHSVSSNDLLVFNDTRVIPARLFAHKETGGRVEILIERILKEKTVLAYLRASKSLPAGMPLLIAGQPLFTVLGREGDLFRLAYVGKMPLMNLLASDGHIPLPPYVSRSDTRIDQERYQTVYAKYQGSVAAPTAGLHFDHPLLDALQLKGVQFAWVTLHIGAGTFAPVRVNDIKEHRMHREMLHVSSAVCDSIQKTKAQGGRVIAVGTTTVRSLETAALSGQLMPFSGETDIFIYPGFKFRCVDALITNFHLPCSTLLMLVCAFGGYDRVMSAYQEAIQKKYRFFSYGDAMMVYKN